MNYAGFNKIAHITILMVVLRGFYIGDELKMQNFNKTLLLYYLAQGRLTRV